MCLNKICSPYYASVDVHSQAGIDPVVFDLLVERDEAVQGGCGGVGPVEPQVAQAEVGLSGGAGRQDVRQTGGEVGQAGAVQVGPARTEQRAGRGGLGGAAAAAAQPGERRHRAGADGGDGPGGVRGVVQPRVHQPAVAVERLRVRVRRGGLLLQAQLGNLGGRRGLHHHLGRGERGQRTEPGIRARFVYAIQRRLELFVDGDFIVKPVGVYRLEGAADDADAGAERAGDAGQTEPSRPQPAPPAPRVLLQLQRGARRRPASLHWFVFVVRELLLVVALQPLGFLLVRLALLLAQALPPPAELLADQCVLDVWNSLALVV